jgi:hypothetical protein
MKKFYFALIALVLITVFSGCTQPESGTPAPTPAITPTPAPMPSATPVQTPSQYAGVTIKTGKTAYMQGEIIRAEVEADANGRNYFYDSTIYPYSTDGNNPKIWVEMLENGRWAAVLKDCALVCGDIDCNSGQTMPCLELGPGGCSKIGKHLWEWGMKTCDKASGTADGNKCQYIEESDAKPGTYRLSLDVSLNSCNEGTAVHSNEFTVK